VHYIPSYCPHLDPIERLLNIHGAIDLETGATRMIEATTIDALSSIALLMAIALMYPTKRLIHVFLDNARYHHAVLVQEWLARPG
jgi:transposase